MSGKSQYSYKLALQMAQSWSSLRQPLEAQLISNNKLPLIDQQFIKALDLSTFYELTFFLLLFTITSTLFKVKYYNPSMSDAQQLISESLSDELALFSKLIPTEEQKPKLPSVNLLLKKSLDGELQKKLKARQQSRRSRSRSRDRAKKMRKQQNLQDEKKAIIVLSDDEEESAGHFNKFRALEKGIYDPIECYEQQVGMTYRQKQKIDRLMERGMRHFREGKVRDQLSFQIFNTIEAYFK